MITQRPPRWKNWLMILGTALLLLLTLAPLSGVLTPSTAAARDRVTRVRVVHAIADAPAVDVSVNGSKPAATITFFTVTDYLTLTPGTYRIEVVPAGATLSSKSLVFKRTFSLHSGDYTIIARGTLKRGDSAGVSASKVFDGRKTPADGNALVRVAHFSPDAGRVDIYFNGNRTLAGVKYTTISSYLSVPAGTYTVGVAPAGGKIIYTTSVTLQAGQVATAWANGLLGGTDAQAFKVTPRIDR